MHSFSLVVGLLIGFVIGFIFLLFAIIYLFGKDPIWAHQWVNKCAASYAASRRNHRR